MSKTQQNLHIQYLPIADLQPYENNARTHSQTQLKKIAASIRRLGFLNPVLADGQNRMIAGHGRMLAAKMNGMTEVPVIRIEHLTDAELRTYIIADNKLAELAGWDESILAIEFQHLSSLDLDFDLSLTGFDLPKIDFMIQGLNGQLVEADIKEPAAIGPAVTKPGDIWLLGRHRLLCGSALEPADYALLMDGDQAQVIFTDPPYNVRIDGNVSGLGRVQHAEFAMASGEMTKDEFTRFLRIFIQLAARHAVGGSIHYICMDWRHLGELLAAGHETYAELKNICVWNKTNAGMGSLYRSKHELVLVWKHGTASHINNIELGKHGRHRTNVWDYAGQTIPHADRDDELAMHPTVKPVALVADALLDCSHRDGIVLDPFGGSGTTLIAAEQTGRLARLIELESKYVDVTIRRWQELTGLQAVHAVSRQAFDTCYPSARES